MKYTEEKIIQMLGADLSAQSKIKQSLKMRLVEKAQKKNRKVLFLSLTLSAAAAVAVFFLLPFAAKNPPKPAAAEKLYVYNDKPVNYSMINNDVYGEAGPRGLKIFNF